MKQKVITSDILTSQLGVTESVESKCEVDSIDLATLLRGLSTAQEIALVQLVQHFKSQLAAQRRCARQLLETLPMAYVATDPAGKIQEANSAFCDLLEMDIVELKSHLIFDFFNQASLHAMIRALQQLADTDGEIAPYVDLEAELVLPNMSRRKVELRLFIVELEGSYTLRCYVGE